MVMALKEKYYNNHEQVNFNLQKGNLKMGVANAKRNGHLAFHYNPSPATQHLTRVITKYTRLEPFSTLGR